MPRRAGFALAWTLILLVLLGLLSAGAFHASRADALQARRLTLQGAVEHAAELSARRAMEQWQGMDLDSVPISDTLPGARAILGGVSTSARALRSGPDTWWVTAEAWAPDSTSVEAKVRRIALASRLAPAMIAVDAALTARDAVAVTGTGAVVGTDTTGGALDPACATDSGGAGIATPDSTLVRHGAVTGAPAIRVTPSAMAPGTYVTFGIETWADLVARADVRLPAGRVVPAPVVVAGQCLRGVPTNWGDPAGGACARWAPIVHVAGDLWLDGGRGQGILLVDGTATIAGGAEFVGVLIVRDDVRTGAGGGTIRGAVLAADTSAMRHSEVGDGLRIQRSSCAVRAAWRRHARLRAMRLRAWAPLG